MYPSPRFPFCRCRGLVGCRICRHENGRRRLSPTQPNQTHPLPSPPFFLFPPPAPLDVAAHPIWHALTGIDAGQVGTRTRNREGAVDKHGSSGPATDVYRREGKLTFRKRVPSHLGWIRMPREKRKPQDRQQSFSPRDLRNSSKCSMDSWVREPTMKIGPKPAQRSGAEGAAARAEKITAHRRLPAW